MNKGRHAERPDGAVLTVHPGSASLRQWQKRALERDGFADGRAHVSLSGLLRACEDAARAAGFLQHPDNPQRSLRSPGDLDYDLALVEAVTAFRSAHPDDLASLSHAALEATLDQLIGYLSPLAADVPRALEVLRNLPPTGKNRALASLYEAFDRVCLDRGLAVEARVNAAILQLLGADRSLYPAVLRDARTILFIHLRWLPPFLEALLDVLRARLGEDAVEVHYLLAEHEQEWWGGRLLKTAGRMIFGDADSTDGWSRYHSGTTAESIEALLGLRDGFAMLDPGLAAAARTRVGFSWAVGIYGEVEDMARRIVWLTRRRKNPVRPDRIAFVVRHLGDYADAVTDVFGRFGIPYHFRRGTPALSVPVVKTVTGLLDFSASQSRDAFCALLGSPWLDWRAALADDQGRLTIGPEELADHIRRAGVEPEIPSADSLRTRLETFYAQNGRSDARARSQAAVRAFALARGRHRPADLGAALRDLFRRCDDLNMRGRLDDWARESRGRRHESVSYFLNGKAYAVARSLLEDLAASPRAPGATDWGSVASIVRRALGNLTVADPAGSDDGVWVLNPFDMAGLEFDAVLAAGLNAGMFPVLPDQNPIFSDRELEALRQGLGQRVPATALAVSGAKTCQENLLLLSVIAAAREYLAFSRTAYGESGEPQAPSVYYAALWRLVGWPALGNERPAEPPDPYDVWRMERSFSLREYWAAQSAAAPSERQPFAGESSLRFVPLDLCCAADEARQSVAATPSAVELSSLQAKSLILSSAALAAAHGLRMEADRESFHERAQRADAEPQPGLYTGAIPSAVWKKLREQATAQPPDLSAGAVEVLATCPFQYLLSKILAIEEIRTQELEPDAMDWGSAVHKILNAGFRLLRDDPPDAWPLAARFLEPVAGRHRDLVRPAWAVRDTKEGWRLTDRAAPGPDALPVVRLDPALAARWREFFDQTASAFQQAHEQGAVAWKLGPATLASVEWRRVRRAVRNVVAALLDGGAGEFDDLRWDSTDEIPPLTRCVALIEHEFHSRKTGLPPSVEFADPSGSGRKLRIHGILDRADLLFDASGRHGLRAVVVTDYKGKSQANQNPAALAAGIATARNCQLPVYSLAAAQRLFGDKPPPALRVIAQYCSYRDDAKKIAQGLRKNWISLDGQPLDATDLEEAIGDPQTDLMTAFTRSLFACLDRLESGRFAVESLDCGYCAFRGICRYAKPELAEESEAAS